MAKNPLVTVERGHHIADDKITEFHLKMAAKMHMGIPFKLPYHSKVTAVVIDDYQVIIKYYRYDATRLARETRYNAAWVVADVYACVNDEWSFHDRYEAPDDTFMPHTVHEAASQHRDEAAQRERRMFEGDCYRPGASRFPMDNAQRTAEGYTTPQMERHWS
jgi:hypothetical protein